MFDEYLTRSLALIQASARKIEEKREVFSDLGDIQALDTLNSDLSHHIQSYASSGLIPVDPSLEVKKRLTELSSFFDSVNFVYNEVMCLGKEELQVEVPSVSEESLSDLSKRISELRQSLHSKLAKCQSQLYTKDWVGRLGETDIHPELVKFYEVSHNHLLYDSTARVNLCAFVFGTGCYWDSVMNHFKVLEQRILELHKLRSKHILEISNATSHALYGNYKTANSIMLGIGVNYSKSSSNGKFIDIDYSKIESLLAELHSKSCSINEFVSIKLPSELEKNRKVLGVFSSSIWKSKSIECRQNAAILLGVLERTCGEYISYIHGFPNSEIYEDHFDVLNRGAALIEGGREYSKADLRLGDKKRNQKLVAVCCVILIILTFFIYEYRYHFGTKLKFDELTYHDASDFSDTPTDVDVSVLHLGDMKRYFLQTSSWRRALPGDYLLLVRSPNYSTYKKEFKLKVGQKFNLGEIPLQIRSGTVEIKSEPTGAEVFLGSELLGQTPIKLNKVFAQTKRYRLTLPRHKAVDLYCNLQDNQKIELFHDFKSKKVALNTDAPNSKVILLGGEEHSLPWEGMLPLGKNYIRIINSNNLISNLKLIDVLRDGEGRFDLQYNSSGVLRCYDNTGAFKGLLRGIADFEITGDGSQLIALSMNGDVSSVYMKDNVLSHKTVLNGAVLIAETPGFQAASMSDGRLLYWGVTKDTNGQLIPSTKMMELEVKGKLVKIQGSRTADRLIGLGKDGQLYDFPLSGEKILTPPKYRALDFSFNNVTAGVLLADASGGSVVSWPLSNNTVIWRETPVKIAVGLSEIYGLMDNGDVVMSRTIVTDEKLPESDIENIFGGPSHNGLFLVKKSGNIIIYDGDGGYQLAGNVKLPDYSGIKTYKVSYDPIHRLTYVLSDR